MNTYLPLLSCVLGCRELLLQTYTIKSGGYLSRRSFFLVDSILFSFKIINTYFHVSPNYCIFATMIDEKLNKEKWSENVVIVDADYVDKVAFDLSVNFERMIGRRIPKADLARWVDCIALDGGLREGEHETQVVLIHDKRKAAMENFAPSRYGDELNGKAFKDNLGEFIVSSFPVEDVVKGSDFFLDVLAMVCALSLIHI